VPLVAALGAALAPRRALALASVPAGAVLGWGVLLLRAARAPRFGRLTDVLSGLLPLSPLALAGATLMLALLLGVGGALIGTAFARRPTVPEPRAP
jgi:hypothetical protein